MQSREQVLVDERLGLGAARCGIFAGGPGRCLLSQHLERSEAAPPALFFGFGLALLLRLRLARSLGFRSPARFFFLSAALLRFRALVRSLLFIDLARKGIEAREKVGRGSTAGFSRIGRDGLCVVACAGARRAPAGLVLRIAGVVSHPISQRQISGRTPPEYDAANNTLPHAPCARSAVQSRSASIRPANQ